MTSIKFIAFPSLGKAMGLCLSLALLLANAESTHAAYVYVGSYDFVTLGGLSNGQYDASNPWWWGNNPPVYSAVEAAAVIFGGNASDYAISTVGTDPGTINHLAFVDGWADYTYLFTPTSETFKLDSGNPGYNDPGGMSTAFSALVFDHGPSFPTTINYVFRQDSAGTVPEPTTLAIWGMLGGLGLIAARRRRRTA
jgi:MYXO-CTERM domain-containing protein